METEAGVPHGSVTYWFGNRDGLLAAAVERMRELDEQRVAAMAQQLVMAFATSGLDAVIDAVAEGGAAMFEADTVVVMARYEMLLAGARDEAIGPLIRECSRAFWELAKPVVIAAGSQDPDGDARILMAMLDGLFFDQLTKGERDPELLRRGNPPGAALRRSSGRVGPHGLRGRRVRGEERLDRELRHGDVDGGAERRDRGEERQLAARGAAGAARTRRRGPPAPRRGVPGSRPARRAARELRVARSPRSAGRGVPAGARARRARLTMLGAMPLGVQAHPQDVHRRREQVRVDALEQQRRSRGCA